MLPKGERGNLDSRDAVRYNSFITHRVTSEMYDDIGQFLSGDPPGEVSKTEVDMSVDVNLNEVPEEVQAKVQGTVEENAKRARCLSRKVALAALGLAGLTYDAGKSAVRKTDGFVNRAEKRGEEIEAILNSRVSEVQDQMTEEAKAQRAKLEGTLNNFSTGMGDRGKSIEKRVQSGLSSLKIGSGTVVETDQISIEVEIVDEEPWEGYDELNAQEVIDRLAMLGEAQLEAVSDYEANTKNRVTVLREIDMLLAGIEEPPVS